MLEPLRTTHASRSLTPPFACCLACRVRSTLSILGTRIAAELQGASCLPLAEAAADRQSIATMRTFGRMIESRAEMADAISTYASRAAEKLRIEGVGAAHVSVFVQTNPHNGDAWYASQCASSIERRTTRAYSLRWRPVDPRQSFVGPARDGAHASAWLRRRADQ
ncbi:DinB/UmuC family translesion DNA polymerase [Ameyamaea chiangmaiensis]|uniref:DinB/UmuC family translesion DNA polymerase n=1 Tax=Ameyamaea chiangmaiensis TaxID=442969 RepID=UPI00357122A8